jgi:peroxiredoxin Q/BCP
MASALKAGDKAPPFRAETTAGAVRLKDFAGKYLVLYFYPKDDTPGCTTEAADFSALSKAFDGLGAAILGVSRDSLEKHSKFADKHGLKIPLASDTDGRLCETYGTWVEKKLYGRTYMGIARRTFLIGPDGRILHVWDKVKVKGHAAGVLQTLQDHLAQTARPPARP